MNGNDFIVKMGALGYNIKPNEWKPWEAALLDVIHEMAEKVNQLEKPISGDLGDTIGAKVKAVIESELRPGGLLDARR